jgi:methionine-rich copper-binding protein CopC
MPRVSRPILALVACTSLLLAVAAPVVAHAELVATSPADGAQLDAVPAEATLTFSAELDPARSAFTVTGPDGDEVGSGTVDLQVADRNVLSGSIAGEERGAYAIAWTAVAADGHEGTGTLHFSVGGDGLADTSMPPGSAPIALVGWLLLAAAAALLGRRMLQR